MPDQPEESVVSFEAALKVADAAVFATTSRRLKNIEVAILQGVWQGQKYDQIAEAVGYAPEYIKHDVGPKLWQTLSASFGEKVSKSNLVAVLWQRVGLSELELENMKADGGQESEDSSRSPISTLPSPDAASSTATLELPVGIVPLNSPFYIERPPVEARCYAEIMRPGALIRIKAPSQMGKTSLMVRILADAKQQGSDADPASAVQTVPLSFQQADSQIFTDLDRFLRWFCVSITRKLQLPQRVDDYWSDTFGSKGNCTMYFEDCLLPQISGPLIIALDHVDEVFLHPEIADDFFTLLRSWYEEAAYGQGGSPLWQNVRLIIVHSTEVYIPLDVNRSPFNVGLAVELQEFTAEQAIALAQRHQLQLAESELAQLMQLVSGHPYLLRQAFYYLARQEITLPQLLQTAATDAGIYHGHLHRLLEYLQQHPTLAAAFNRVAKATEPVELEQLLVFKLHSTGLVTLDGNRVLPSCELYRQYFGDREL
jgi:hypothetical protein